MKTETRINVKHLTGIQCKLYRNNHLAAAEVEEPSLEQDKEPTKKQFEELPCVSIPIAEYLSPEPHF